MTRYEFSRQEYWPVFEVEDLYEDDSWLFEYVELSDIERERVRRAFVEFDMIQNLLKDRVREVVFEEEQ